MLTPLSSLGAPESVSLTEQQFDEKKAQYVSLKKELAKTFHGMIALRGESLFAESVAIFNHAAPLGAWMVVLPTSALEISTIVKFCNAQRISPSVKSGGYATAGWSIQGDIVIDTKRMDDIQLHLPKANVSNASAGVGSSSDTAGAGIAPENNVGSLETGSNFANPSMHARADKSGITIQTDSAQIIDQVAQDKLTGPTSGFPTPSTSQPLVNCSTSSTNKRVRAEDSAARSSPENDDTTNSAPLRRRLAQSPSEEVERLSTEPQVFPSPNAANTLASSNESGADADSEDSYAGSEQNEDARASGSKPVDDIIMNDESGESSTRQEYMTASEPRDSAKLYPTSTQPGRRFRNWTNRQMERAGNMSNSSGSGSASGSNSGSNGGTSSSNPASSSTSISKTSTSRIKSPTSGASALEPTASSSHATGPAVDHISVADHRRESPSTAGDRLVLPEGGFTWTSDGSKMGFTSELENPTWATEGLAATMPATYRSQPASSAASGAALSSENDAFAASTLTDLQDAWPAGTWAVNPEVVNDTSSRLPRFMSTSSESQISPPASGDRGSHSSGCSPEVSPSVNTSVLPAGIYKERYALASFGPGAGIRALDAFTDRAGRDGNILAHRDDTDKGKAKADIEEHSEMPLVINGVPYHIPGSAYPVGSSSMTVGGFGYLTRAYGLSLDNIVEVEMVLADGRIMTLNAESNNKTQEERDLWWAARGAAPCFGIVSRLTLKAYPVPSVYSGNLIYPLNPATASSLIRHWRDCLKSGLPRTFYSNLILTAGPSKTSHVIVIQVCFLGSKSDGEALVQMISSWTGERLLLKDVEERSFLRQQDGVAKVLKGGTGRRWMVRGDLISTLTDEVISQSVRKFQGLGSRAVWLFELLGGAVEDTPAEETCIGTNARSAKFIVGSLQQWSGEADDRPCIENVDNWLSEVVGKVSIGGPFPCFLSHSEPMCRVMGSFGLPNFQRLLQIKKRIDPNNLFRHAFGQGLGVDNAEQLLAELETKDTQRKAVQQNTSASASSEQTLVS